MTQGYIKLELALAMHCYLGTGTNGGGNAYGWSCLTDSSGEFMLNSRIGRQAGFGLLVVPKGRYDVPVFISGMQSFSIPPPFELQSSKLDTILLLLAYITVFSCDTCLDHMG